MNPYERRFLFVVNKHLVVDHIFRVTISVNMGFKNEIVLYPRVFKASQLMNYQLVSRGEEICCVFLQTRHANLVVMMQDFTTFRTFE